MKKVISIILVCLFVLIGSMALANPLEKLIGMRVDIRWGTQIFWNNVDIVDVIDSEWFVFKSSRGKYHYGYIPTLTYIWIRDSDYIYERRLQ